MRRMAAAWAAAAGLGLAVVVATASPAGAVINGPCTAEGEFTADDGASGPTSVVVDANDATGVIEVPSKASVAWEGTVGSGGETAPRAHNGAISIVLPPVLDELFGGYAEVKTWSDDDATTTAESGVSSYDIPGIVPAGAKIVVSGFHNDPAGSCTGTVTLKLEGTAITEPVTIVMLGLTAGTAVLLVITGRGVA